MYRLFLYHHVIKTEAKNTDAVAKMDTYKPPLDQQSSSRRIGVFKKTNALDGRMKRGYISFISNGHAQQKSAECKTKTNSDHLSVRSPRLQYCTTYHHEIPLSFHNMHPHNIVPDMQGKCSRLNRRHSAPLSQNTFDLKSSTLICAQSPLPRTQSSKHDIFNVVPTMTEKKAKKMYFHLKYHLNQPYLSHSNLLKRKAIARRGQVFQKRMNDKRMITIYVTGTSHHKPIYNKNGR